MSTVVPPPLPAPTVTVNAAARYLSISGTPLRKGLRSGLIPDLTFTTVGALAARDIVIAATNTTGQTVPVVRLTDITVDTEDPTRDHYGYGHTMDDDALLATSDRWWTSSGRDLVYNAQALLVVHASLVIGWLDIDPGGTVTNAEGKLHYAATLVARCDDVVTRTIRVIDQDSPNLEQACEILGLRALGGGGGSITTL